MGNPTVLRARNEPIIRFMVFSRVYFQVGPVRPVAAVIHVAVEYAVYNQFTRSILSPVDIAVRVHLLLHATPPMQRGRGSRMQMPVVAHVLEARVEPVRQ